MTKLLSLIFACAVGLYFAKVFGPIPARQLMGDAPSSGQAREQIQSVTHSVIPTKAPTLQENIHREVLAGKKGLPRMKTEQIRLVAVDEAQNQIMYMYEIVGVALSGISPLDVDNMRHEIAANFRGSACRNGHLLQLLRRGMTIAQTYRVSDTRETIFTIVLSERDC